MQFGRIVLADGRRDPALCMAGIAVLNTTLGNNQDTAVFNGQQGAV